MPVDACEFHGFALHCTTESIQLKINDLNIEQALKTGFKIFIQKVFKNPESFNDSGGINKQMCKYI